MGQDWSIDEVRATVVAYFEMLEQELRGQPLNKSSSRRRLGALLSERSEGAIERKHQNLSAILIELGFPYVRGYKPLSNYQRLLAEVVRDRLPHATSLIEAVRARALAPLADALSVDGELLGRLVEPPIPSEPRSGPSRISDRPRVRPIANYLELEAQQILLGAAGESFTLKFEAERLWRAGQKELANRVEHVSRTRGDGAGYDVLSFEETGRERLIEVKTTTFGPHTPFFVTRNEVRVSADHADQYYVYRLFNFRDDPRLFMVPGGIASSFTLEATQFVARVD
ncbi:MAG TPA: DUF3883 domain-containing protein [Thermoanaerobaculia bacterium]|jgi:hypothetical protein|nr:DUF3883 domain-containing protein [Thermoanaerobaculia bacterium]